MKIEFVLENAVYFKVEREGESACTMDGDSGSPLICTDSHGLGGCTEVTKVRTTTTTTRGTWTKSSKSWFWQRWRRRGVNIRQKNQFIVYIVFARILIGCYALLCGSLLLLDCFGSIKGKTDNIKLVCIALF